MLALRLCNPHNNAQCALINKGYRFSSRVKMKESKIHVR